MRCNNLFSCLLSARFLFIFAAFLVTSSCALAEGQINWHDADAGLAVGKDTHKMILVDLYTDWCRYCKKLDETTFTDPKLIDYLNDKFVCVKANAETSKEGRRIKKEFTINGYPCTLVFNETGTYLGKFEGCTNASGYKIMVDKIINKPVADSQINLNAIIAGSQNSDKSSTGNLSNNSSSSTSSSDSVDNLKSKLNSAKSLLNRFF